MLKTTCVGLTVLAAASCGTRDADEDPLPADPRVILQASLSHGIGESPLESTLLADSQAAALLVRMRKCIPNGNLSELVGEPDQTGDLEQLRTAGLVLDRDQDTCTSFPILIGEEQATYARLTGNVATSALDTLSSDLTSLLRQVAIRGWSDWQYHFVWSQLFDSQTAWSAMTERGLVPPLGRVIAWSIYPDHPYRSGTNYFPDDELRDYWLMVTWRPNTANTIAAVGGRWRQLYALALEGERSSPIALDTLVRLGLADSTGAVTLPILSDADPLLASLRSTATKYVGFLERHMPLDSLVVVTGVDRSYTFAMAYHDVTWSIVAGLVDAGRLSVPRALEPSSGVYQSGLRGVAAFVPVDARFARLILDALEGR